MSKKTVPFKMPVRGPNVSSRIPSSENRMSVEPVAQMRARGPPTSPGPTNGCSTGKRTPRSKIGGRRPRRPGPDCWTA